MDLYLYHRSYNRISKILLIFSIIIYVTSGAIQSLSDLKNTLNLNPLQLPGLAGVKSAIDKQQQQLQQQQQQQQQQKQEPPTPCTCAVFLSGQFTRGSPEPPRGNPALVHEQDRIFACTPAGLKQCQAKCLETIVRHLPNSADILCATIDRDCHKERAYLFIQNCEPKWHNTNLSAGREYCCKDGLPYQCPLV